MEDSEGAGMQMLGSREQRSERRKGTAGEICAYRDFPRTPSSHSETDAKAVGRERTKEKKKITKKHENPTQLRRDHRGGKAPKGSDEQGEPDLGSSRPSNLT